MGERITIYGVYSAKRDKKWGCSIYLNVLGMPVKVTDAFPCSTMEAAKKEAPWIGDDAIWLGQLGECVRTNPKTEELLAKGRMTLPRLRG